MSDFIDLRSAFREPAPLTQRELRAELQAVMAFAPGRVLRHLLAIPVVAVLMTASIHVATSPYAPPDALRHLLALAGCETADALGVASAREGAPGYHARYDPDGDGVACANPAVSSAMDRPGGAKVLRP